METAKKTRNCFQLWEAFRKCSQQAIGHGRQGLSVICVEHDHNVSRSTSSTETRRQWRWVVLCVKVYMWCFYQQSWTELFPNPAQCDQTCEQDARTSFTKESLEPCFENKTLTLGRFTRTCWTHQGPKIQVLSCAKQHVCTSCWIVEGPCHLWHRAKSEALSAHVGGGRCVKSVTGSSQKQVVKKTSWGLVSCLLTGANECRKGNRHSLPVFLSNVTWKTLLNS